jgi:hypothetical protein
LQIAEKKSEAEREGRRRERLDREVRDLKAQVESKNMEVSSNCMQGAHFTRSWVSVRLCENWSRLCVNFKAATARHAKCLFGACNHSTAICWLRLQVRTKQLDIAGAEEQVARLEGLLKEAKGATDKVQKEFNALSEKVRSSSYDAALWV